MPRGGQRTGKPGTGYPNRTDLQAIRTAPAAQYGQRQAAMEAQQALRLPQVTQPGPTSIPASGPPSAPPAPAAPASAPGMPPGVGLADPTQRPAEPLTAGLVSGPGPGPDNPALHWTDPDLIAIRHLYALHPSEDLRRLIQRWGS